MAGRKERLTRTCAMLVIESVTMDKTMLSGVAIRNEDGWYLRGKQAAVSQRTVVRCDTCLSIVVPAVSHVVLLVATCSYCFEPWLLPYCS